MATAIHLEIIIMDTYTGPCGCDEARDPWTRCDACEASGWTPLSLLTSEERAVWALCEGAALPWRGDRNDGTVKYDVLDVGGSTVIHGCNNNCDPSYGFYSDEAERFVLGASVALPAALTTIATLRAEVRRLTGALATARLDGARAMRERCIIVCENVEGEADADGESGRALAAHHIAQRISNLTLDPAAVVGSGS